jgi:hypothetical protein
MGKREKVPEDIEQLLEGLAPEHIARVKELLNRASKQGAAERGKRDILHFPEK